GHVFDAGAYGVHVPDVAAHHRCGKHVPEGRILPARHDDRQILFAGGHHPGMLRVDLETLLQLPAAKNLVHEFVREIMFSRAVDIAPAIVISIFPPAARCASYPFAASSSAAALK